MEEVVQSGFLEMVYRWGALPLLIFAVWVLWKKVSKLETSIESLNDNRITDVKTHAEEVKGLQQNTLNTLNDLSHKIIK